MFTLAIAGAAAAASAYLTHAFKEANKDTGESIAREYGEARTKVNNTIAGAEALAVKLKSTL